MKIAGWAALAAVCIAVLMGWLAGSGAPPERTPPDAETVDSTWYAELPADPVAATDAFLQRVPPSARVRGDAFGATRYVTLPLRILTLLGSVALLVLSGAADRGRALVDRFVGPRFARDAAFASLLLLAFFVLNLPIETYAGYVRMRHAGFSDMAYSAWLLDLVLRWAADSVFYVAGLAMIVALIRARPTSWAGWATVVYLGVSMLYVVSEPWMEGISNRLTPLEDGPAKEAVLSLARANGVPAQDVFVQDASRQSQLLNAHVSGMLGSARIVLDDTTIERVPQAEVAAVMAHEVGHYALGHIPKSVLFNALVMGIGLMLVQALVPRLIARFGPGRHSSELTGGGGVTLMWGLFLLWGWVALPLSNGISRTQEAEADLFALNAAREPIAQAEFMMRDADTGQLHPSPLEEWVFYGHPSPRSRILMAMRWRAEHLASR